MKLSTALLGALAGSSAVVSAFVTPSSSSSSITTQLQASKARGSGYGTPLDNISESVGNTPLVKISDRIAPAGRTIYAKCEFFNPLSSVKDRLALSIIETAEKVCIGYWVSFYLQFTFTYDYMFDNITSIFFLYKLLLIGRFTQARANGG